MSSNGKYKYDNANNNNIVKKSGSDDMRAFYDFCMDFMAEDRLLDIEFNEMDNLLEWCEEPDLLKMAIIDIKNRKKG